MSDFLGSMYSVDDDVVEPRINHTVVREPESKSTKTRRINVGIVGYDVPNVEYVAALEKKIEKLEALAMEQGNQLRRMQASVMRLQNALHRLGGNVTTVSKELNNKIDRRTE